MSNGISLFLKVLPFILISMSCNNNPESSDARKTDTSSNVSTDQTGKYQLPNRDAFRDTVDGKITDLYILRNANGMAVAITNYGGRIVSLLVPDKNGELTDVVVGFKNLDGYLNSTEAYFGATIGRYGNRIAKGKFTLDGQTYTLALNNGPNSLHGGTKGFQAVVWDAKQLDDSTLEMSYISKDMEEGYPGNLTVKVTCGLTSGNELTFSYEAVTDKKTVVNLTNHAFYNLNGEGSGTINNHLLQINADQYTPVDSTLIPVGKHAPVAGTPFDFRQPTPIGQRLDAEDMQLRNGNGYDHNFVLRDFDKKQMKHAATVTGEKTGIVMEVYTEEPGLQFYGGNFMKGANRFKSGKRDDFRTAFCLETQHFPDSPNQPGFPSTVLAPGQTYSTKTIYRFRAAAKD